MAYGTKLTQTEQKVWDNACALFNELLDDLNSKYLLRKGTIQVDRKNLALIWENSRNYGMTLNEFYKVFESEESVKHVASCSGLTTQTLTYLFISQLVGTMLINYESVFKTSLIFFLEEEKGIKRDMTLGQLLNAIRDISPSTGTKLKTMIDTALRNSIAHGNFWFMQNGKVFLAKNSYLQDVKEIKLVELMIEAKRINVIAHAFIHVLDEKVKQSYFKL